MCAVSRHEHPSRHHHRAVAGHKGAARRFAHGRPSATSRAIALWGIGHRGVGSGAREAMRLMGQTDGETFGLRFGLTVWA